MEVTALVGGIQKFSTSDGPGIRTSVFLQGCPLRCQWCHNPELIERKKQHMFSDAKCIGCGACAQACPAGAINFTVDGPAVDREKCIACFRCTSQCYAEAMRTSAKEMSVSQVMEEVLKDRGYYQRTGGGLTISGGECLSNPEFTTALAQAARDEGISVVLDTSGYCPSAVMLSLAHLADYLLYDFKCVDDSVHKRYIGVSNKLILDNLELLAKEQDLLPKLWIRMPLIHQVNDTPTIIEATRDLLAAWHIPKVTLLPYHELGSAKYRSLGVKQQDFQPPSDQRLQEIAECFNAAGVPTDILGQDIQ